MDKYRHKRLFQTDVRDVDFADRLKVSTILSRFESVASGSADELGFGYGYLKEHGYAFFLAEVCCTLSRPITLGEGITFVTWPAPPRYAVFGREFEAYDASSKKVLSATSRWCAVDFSSGKILTQKAFPEQNYLDTNIYDPTPSGVVYQKTPKIAFSDGEERFSVRIANSEYDHNMHVNNTRYADYCLNCFSVDELKTKSVSSFSIAYVKQCREGDFLRFVRQDVDGGSLVCGFNQNGELVVRAAFSFQPFSPSENSTFVSRATQNSTKTAPLDKEPRAQTPLNNEQHAQTPLDKEQCDQSHAQTPLQPQDQPQSASKSYLRG